MRAGREIWTSLWSSMRPDASPPDRGRNNVETDDRWEDLRRSLWSNDVEYPETPLCFIPEYDAEEEPPRIDRYEIVLKDDKSGRRKVSVIAHKSGSLVRGCGSGNIARQLARRTVRRGNIRMLNPDITPWAESSFFRWLRGRQRMGYTKRRKKPEPKPAPRPTTTHLIDLYDEHGDAVLLRVTPEGIHLLEGTYEIAKRAAVVWASRLAGEPSPETPHWAVAMLDRWASGAMPFSSIHTKIR